MTALEETRRDARHDARRHCERFLEATQATTMKPLLLAALGGDDAETCHVLDAKYELGKRSVVLYQLGDRLVRATVGPKAGPGDGIEVLDQVRITSFPNDPALPTLPDVADSRTLATALDRALPGTRVTHVRTRLLRYRPGRRATFLVTAGLRRSGETVTTRMVAKVYHDPSKAAAVAAEGVALQRGAMPPALALAPIVAHVPELVTVVQGHLYGRELNVGDATRGRPTAAVLDDVARSARALEAFHRRTVPAGRARSIDRELERFISRANGVLAVDVDTGSDLLDLAHRLGALRRVRPGGPTSLVHGDCKPSQFLIQSDAVALLDLDHCGIADPAYDVGNFLASLRQHAVQAGPASARAQRWATELSAAFADSYLTAASPSRVSDPDGFCSRIDFYAAVALTRKALRAFARAPRSPLPGLLVAEAHRGLDRPGGSRS